MKKLKLEVDFGRHSSKNIKVVSDQKRLKQVIFNLVSNAFKFTDKGFIQVLFFP